MGLFYPYPIISGDRCDFAAVRHAIDKTDSNARAHLRKLENTGYIAIGRRRQDLRAAANHGRQP